MTVLIVSFDRLWAICFPISYLHRNHRLTTVLIFFSWLIPVVIGVLPVLGMNGMNKFQNKCIVTTVMSFNHMFISSSYIIFVSAVMIATYTIVYFRIVKQVIRMITIIMTMNLKVLKIFRETTKN